MALHRCLFHCALSRQRKSLSSVHSLLSCFSSDTSDKIPIVSYPSLSEEQLDNSEPAPRRRRNQETVFSASEILTPTRDPGAAAYSSDVIPAPYEVKPRVAPLPEYRPSTEQTQQAAETPTFKRPSLSLFQRQLRDFIPEDQMQIPLPSLVKVERKPRPEPVTLMDAIRQVKGQKKKARFDETIEAHIRLGVDPKRSDQIVRGAASLPHGIGKIVRVAVFAEGDDAEEAKAAGADIVGSDDLISKIAQSGGKLDFEKCVATPAMMPKISKVARILGPRGLMPNPKVGTVTKAVGTAVKNLKQGRVDFRADKGSLVHAGIGKMSFTEENLFDNIVSFANAVLLAKPPGLKKTSKFHGYFLSFSICSTMGPGFRVMIPSISQAVDNYTKMSGIPGA